MKSSPNKTPLNESETTMESGVASGEQEQLKGKKFGTFNGVFRPTILTILGVMMYLREGWVVGNAGLGGALLIILMSFGITGTAALSISSITTNIRLGAGGVFSIVSQSLGLEVGGSIGIPFYLAQSLSSAMYIYGFMEGWLYIFPDHHPALIILTVFLVIFFLSYFSTSMAFRIQMLVMLGVILALVSIFLGIQNFPEFQKPELWGKFDKAPFWKLFAVFFPAATGIMIGASMSGNLLSPRESIPRGTLSAWALSLLVYLGLALWYSLVATPEELKNKLTIAIDKSFWGPAVLIGIMSSCFSAALSSFVAAPRILQALASHNIFPYSHFFSRLHKEEPRNAIASTGLLVAVALLLGDLNAIARVLTVIFLLTYFAINSILLLEQGLNLISFRPSFSIPLWVPILGAMTCLIAILIISPFLGLLSLFVLAAIYIYLSRSALQYPVETVRSGLFIGIAHWAAKKVSISSEKNTLRSWRPSLLILIERDTQLEGVFRLLLGLVSPQGSIQIIGLKKDAKASALKGLKDITRDIQKEGIFASSARIDSTDFHTSVETSVAILKDSFFGPNIIFSVMEKQTKHQLQHIMKVTRANQMGVILYAPHSESGTGHERKVNLWIRDQSPDWQLSFDLSSIDLSMILGYKLIDNWNVHLTVICLVESEKNTTIAEAFIGNLLKLARMPENYEVLITQGRFSEFLPRAPRADINIFGMGDNIEYKSIERMVKRTNSSCLFVAGSGRESILA